MRGRRGRVLVCVATGAEAVRVDGLPLCPVHDFTECLVPPLDWERLDRRIDRMNLAAKVLVLGWALVCGVLYLVGALTLWEFLRSALQPPVAMLGGSLLGRGYRWEGAGLLLLAVVLGVWPWVF